MTGESTQTEEATSKQDFRLLVILAGWSTCLYGIIAILSWQFDFDSIPTDRPIVAVLCLFAVGFACYLGAIRIAWRPQSDPRTLQLIIGSAIVFRVVMLFSLPIQEVDIYRYLWDGAVSTAGVSPFRYSPQQVRLTESSPQEENALRRLAEMREEDPAIAEILHRVHFSELPTIYPPTSQAVFAAANLTTPSSSSLLTRLFVMKAWFIGFDLATLLVVIALLRQLALPTGLCVIYAWCPLLLKEVANSGHLDAIAVFLTTLSVYMFVRCLGCQAVPESGRRLIDPGRLSYAVLAGVVLAFAVGAKLYPIVLAPLILLALVRRRGWRFTLVPAATFIITTLALLSPIVPSQPATAGESQAHDPSLGVVTFLRRWEMNDFLFLIVIENLKPTAQRGPHETAWFTVIPESARESMVDSVSAQLNLAPAEVPFLISRAITATIFMIIAVTLAWRSTPQNPKSFCESAFLTIAWFWLLCPTLNPWYWTWALPLLPFTRSRVWLALSGLVFLYYLRFWLDAHFPTTAVLRSPYTGAAFFDFVVTWIEFGPWFVALAMGFLIRFHLKSTRASILPRRTRCQSH
ncbi:hypothetical protein RISK_000584 [Rhodopirellula islandica]|uniref:Transmembrane protein n=1 Tax=Rhodopirellula islandica TaxID=595434 RepID=A0A0J1BLU8_RHOIS|nr:DUF2029 domain-containing protein [Rhodopirellula islandica]KLU07506.1 hypothetical protein RISK_000584 [Rhodopirellula islandica]